MQNLDLKKKINDTIYGVAAGDALGNPAQFFPRERVKAHPVTDMIAGGVYHKKAGTWTDDTSMTLCLAASLAANDELNLEDIMDRFSDWLYDNEYTPNEKTFDVGQTCLEAIEIYDKGFPVSKCGLREENNNGNGSLMRISPIVFYIWKKFGPDAFEKDEAFDVVHKVSALTHAHNRSLLGCDIYVALLLEILKGTEKSKLRRTVLPKIGNYVQRHPEFEEDLNYYDRISHQDFIDLPEDDIQSSGYIVHTLEAALWCFLNTDSYEECLLKAVNLGWDADTVGAVSGGLAGLYYSGTENGLPEKWYLKIRNKTLINAIVKKMSEKLEG